MVRFRSHRPCSSDAPTRAIGRADAFGFRPKSADHLVGDRAEILVLGCEVGAGFTETYRFEHLSTIASIRLVARSIAANPAFSGYLDQGLNLQFQRRERSAELVAREAQEVSRAPPRLSVRAPAAHARTHRRTIGRPPTEAIRRGHHLGKANERNDPEGRMPHEFHRVHDLAARRPGRWQVFLRNARPGRVRAEVPGVQSDGLAEGRAARQIPVREPACRLVGETAAPVSVSASTTGVAKQSSAASNHSRPRGSQCARLRSSSRQWRTARSRRSLPSAPNKGCQTTSSTASHSFPARPVERHRLIHADVRLATPDDRRDLLDPLVQLGKDFRQRLAGEIAIPNRASREHIVVAPTAGPWPAGG